MTILKYIGFSLSLCSAPLTGQILQDTAVLDLVRKDIDCIYNLQFDDAREIYSEITRSYSGHPIVSLLKGMMIYWENYPLLPASPEHVTFEKELRQCIKLSETNKNPVYDAEYLLADLCARGLLLTFYSDNELVMEVIPLTISTYKYLRRSFDYCSVYSDFEYFTGVYNYYREAYPKAYPVYKSLAILFPPGDEVKGIMQIKSAALNSVALRAESYFLLSWIYLNFENKYPEGLYYCKTLHEKYPENLLYLAIYIKNLLLIKQYDDAEKLVLVLPEEPENKFFEAQLNIFKGILREKKYSDNTLAQQYYNNGIGEISPFGDYGNEYAAYAYYGLSRLSETNGEKHASKIYRREANKLGDFKKLNFDE